MFFPSEKMLPWLERALDMSYRRHTVLAGNVANADTPDYQPRDVDFSEYLLAELSDPGAFGPHPGLPEAQVREGVEPGLDGNQVDIEKEAVALTGNRMFYELGSEVTARNFNMLRYSIDEGGR